MLWLALYFPSLSLEIYSRGAGSELPLVVVDGVDGRQWIVVCCRRAGAAGVMPGMGLSAARALLPGLQTVRRDIGLEREALESLAVWAGRFSARICIEDGRGLLLETGGSLVLFAGLEMLLARIQAELAALGYTVYPASAPTPTGAWWLARGGGRKHLREAECLAAHLAELPIAVLDLPEQILDSLRGMGLERLGAVMAQPRDALARRVGRALPEQLDRALGRCPDPRPGFTPPATFAGSVGLPLEITEHGALRFPLRRLLEELRGYLLATGQGVRRVTLHLLHHGRAASVAGIGLLRPVDDVSRLRELFHTRLERLQLPAPVTALRLIADECQLRAAVTRDLFQQQGDARDWRQLVETLAARLGRERVTGLAMHEDHRPERAWLAVEPGVGAVGQAVSPGLRPLWLLEQPQPLDCRDGWPYRRGALLLRRGPERIEGGWWDDNDVRRDYYLAEGQAGERLWIYRERQPPGRWYLHGLFG